MRGQRAALMGAIGAWLATAAPALAADAVRAELKAHAVLPAQTAAPIPADAPPALQVSGRFAGSGSKRNDRLYSVEGRSGSAPETAPRATGLFLPMVGQPVQGFSGIKVLADGEHLALTDNGFGARANSPDALLMFHRLRPDWETGRIEILETVFLKDPDRLIPFRIALEHTAERYLTGADLDPESIQPVGDLVWIGEEFGPYLIAVDGTGKVVRFLETTVDGKPVRSPDHYGISTPAAPGPVKFELRRSRGFEGMAASPDGRFLYPMLEGPLFLDGTAESMEKSGEREVLRILEVDVAAGTYTGRSWKYPLEAAGNAIGDVNLIDASRALVIERDNNEGDPRLACTGEPQSTCFDKPAAFKRVYLIDLAATDAEGLVRKIAYVDLLDIADPKDVARAGSQGGVFTFPFITIENVDVVGERTIIVGNDNNFPYSNARTPQVADNNELILFDVGDLLSRR